MKNIEVLYFAGGEPFVLEEHFKLLESLQNKKDISLMYNTNFSILKYKGKTIFEYLKDFRKVHFSISLDGLGEVGEFVRTGFDTKIFIAGNHDFAFEEHRFPHHQGDYDWYYHLMNEENLSQSDVVYLEDTYQNPIEIRTEEFLKLCREHYQRVMNTWHQQHAELKRIRKV